MQVCELLKSKSTVLVTTSPTMGILEAMELLIERRISCLPVLDDHGGLVGIISDKDIFRAVYNDPLSFRRLAVADLMTTSLIVGLTTDDAAYIAALMTQNRIRHIPIVDGDKLIGLLSLGDMVKAQLDGMQVENRYLWQYINGSYPG